MPPPTGTHIHGLAGVTLMGQLVKMWQQTSKPVGVNVNPPGRCSPRFIALFVVALCYSSISHEHRLLYFQCDPERVERRLRRRRCELLRSRSNRFVRHAFFRGIEALLQVATHRLCRSSNECAHPMARHQGDWATVSACGSRPRRQQLQALRLAGHVHDERSEAQQAEERLEV